METEILKGRGVLNPDHKIEHVWIDLRDLSDYVHDVQIPEVTGFFKKFVNLDPKKNLCPVRPSNHYQMGGIPTNEFGEVQRGSGSIIPGLFAVGECAAASFHGFNRLGTNSLLELITMGKVVGERVVDFMQDESVQQQGNAGEKTFSIFARFMDAQGKGNLGQIRAAMRAMMTEKVGVFRTEEGLKEAIEMIKELKDRADGIALSSRSLTMNPDLIQRWELENLLEISMVIAQGALYRRESRGGHFRKDFPERKDEFNHHTMATMHEFGKVEISQRPIDMSLYEEKGKSHEKFGMLERKY